MKLAFKPKEFTAKDAWAAGLFDGEGCIHIGFVPPTKSNGTVSASYRVTVKVTMGCKRTVKRFGEVVEAGTFHHHVSKSKRVNASYSWVAMARNAQRVIRILRPYLFTKAAEADIALKFFALPDGRTGGNGGSKPIDPANQRERHKLYLECARLKSRHRFRKKPLPRSPNTKKK